MTMRRLPALDPLLVKALDERFPERCPDPEWSDRQVWVETGKRMVIRFLLEELKAQENNILEN